MAKIIKYTKCTRVNHDTVETPELEEILHSVTIGWNDANEEIAKRESYNGKYTIEDDGQPEAEAAPTQLDRIEAQMAYTAMMTDTLLEV